MEAVTASITICNTTAAATRAPRSRRSQMLRVLRRAAPLIAVSALAVLAGEPIRIGPTAILKGSNAAGTTRTGPLDARARALSAYYSVPMRFEANRGQARTDVKFIARPTCIELFAHRTGRNPRARQ